MKPAIYERTSNFDSDSSKNLPEKSEKGENFRFILFFMFLTLFKKLEFLKHKNLNSYYGICKVFNVCPVKIRSKHSSVLLLCLLRIFSGQTQTLL